MHCLAENEGERAIGMLQNSSIQMKDAREFNVSQSDISRLWKRHQRNGNVTDLPRSGRPRSSTQSQDHLPVTNALKDRFQKPSRLHQQLFHATEARVTNQTVRNRVHVAQLRVRHPNSVLPLNTNHRQTRRVWWRLRQR